MFSHFLHIFSSVPQKRIKKVFYKIKHSELMFFIYVCVKKQMNYTTYLFDFDYTLADSSRGIVTCFRNVLNRHGYTRPTDNDIKRTIGKTLEESFSILSGVTDTSHLGEFKKEYIKEADTHMTVNTVLFLETKSVLAALKDSGARIGIISTKFRYRIKELLDQHFPEDFFDIIVGGEDVQTPKPSPEGLLLAIRQLHATKAETLYIGDSTVDAETAQKAGVDFVMLRVGARGYGSGQIVLDDYFVDNIKRATDAGLQIGVYFTSQAITEEEAVEESNIVLENIKDYKITYPVAFDMSFVDNDTTRIETVSRADKTKITKAFLDTIQAAVYNPLLKVETEWLSKRLTCQNYRHMTYGFPRWKTCRIILIVLPCGNMPMMSPSTALQAMPI